MLSTTRKTAMVVAAVSALGFSGTAIAGAAKNSSSGSERTARSQQPALSDAVAAKVKSAALKKVPGATVVRVERGGPYSTPYHAHIKTSGGKRQVVLVNSDFEATSVQSERSRGKRGRHGRGGPDGGPRGGARETALTGETKEKVEAAVLAKYPGATILRTETNNDSSAPYESHITTSDDKELEVLVSSAFEVVDAR